MQPMDHLLRSEPTSFLRVHALNSWRIWDVGIGKVGLVQVSGKSQVSAYLDPLCLPKGSM